MHMCINQARDDSIRHDSDGVSREFQGSASCSVHVQLANYSLEAVGTEINLYSLALSLMHCLWQASNGTSYKLQIYRISSKNST